MKNKELTADQRAAVYLRDRPVLVSAAAGSGKTRVIVERLMSYITDPENPRDVSDFLIITYTKAAAAELRGRILEELGRRTAENSDDKRLKLQMSLCRKAHIGTIHSFCSSIIRANTHLTGLAPDFTVPDEDKMSEIKAKTLEKLLDSAYEKIEDDEGFRSLVDSVGAGRDDSRLTGLLLNLHSRMQSSEKPGEWAKSKAEAMRKQKGLRAEDTEWGKEITDWAAEAVSFRADQFEKALSRLAGGKIIREAYFESLKTTTDDLFALRKAIKDGSDVFGKDTELRFPRLKPLRGEYDEELAGYIKEMRDACKKDIGKINEILSQSSKEVAEDLARVMPAMDALFKLCVEFDKLYAAEKHSRGKLDFSDLEHIALGLLTDADTGERTALAVDIGKRFTEIMIDEYQDINRVQEMIVNALSRGGRNIFMVGDVKQSVYRFRLADPGIFTEKYLSYADRDERRETAPGERPPTRIMLRENFRSKKTILDAVNHVFSNIMSFKLGEIDYDDKAALRCGAAQEGDDGPPVTLYALEIPNAREEPNEGKADIEAAFTAERIKHLVTSGALVRDKEDTRPVGYGDIVILLHSPGPAAGLYRKALEEAGIPVVSDRGRGFFGSDEVLSVLSLLTVLDNPYADIPLISALRSPMFGFTAQELAEIRLCGPDGSFFDALAAAAKNNEKAAAFTELYKKLRALAPDLTAERLLWLIYNETGIFALCSATGAGEMKRENLMLLFEFARDFEEAGYRGLFRFIRYMRRLEKNGREPGMARVSQNAVRIMSIHKSKGLEFPVVFLCDTSRRFNNKDRTESVLVHSRLGAGPKVSDPEKGTEYPTLARHAVARRLKLEALSEEMRLLYVAVTRAKDRLYITCSVRDVDGMLKKLGAGLTFPPAPQALENCSSHSEWLLMTALPQAEGPLCLSVIKDAAEVINRPAKDFREISSETPDEKITEEIRRRLDFEYPHAAAVMLPSKLTATGLTDRGSENPAEDVSFPQADDAYDYDFEIPDLSENRLVLSGRRRGSAVHTVLQHIDFEKISSPADIRSETERLEMSGFLSSREAKSVDAEMIFNFFASETGRSIIAADSVLREFRFSILCSAREFFDRGGEEQILLQGVVDCCAEKDGELTIIDYKTDNTDDLDKKIELYTPQLRVYAGAMERIMQKPVKRAVLYFLRRNIGVSV
ncbi:MAG: helicase-exonuclease AddAB subunit AddA [Oscillospiraceae bacterium]|nr:helicase-exonuclease AddAB subunit AddA [Oscillospiraceae bacterium]